MLPLVLTILVRSHVIKKRSKIKFGNLTEKTRQKFVEPKAD
ncbi:hypothetical protein FHT67_003870 [Paenibacillus sp. BK720]|nr:hypothetical protein [Paenibacillus sp. BK720]